MAIAQMRRLFDLPPNPFDRQRSHLSWCCFEACVRLGAFEFPVERDGLMCEVQWLYRRLTGKHVMLSTIDRHLRGGPTHPHTFGRSMELLGWLVECPVVDGKKQEGKIRVLSLRGQA